MRELMRLVICGLLCVALPHLAMGEVEDPILKSFEKDQAAAQTAIKTGDLAQALVATSSAVFTWKTHPGFMDLSKSLITTFGYLPPALVKDQYQSMETQLKGNFFGTGWLEAGMMAHAVDDYVTAASCYSQIRFNGSLAANPYPHVLLGKALLAQGRVAEATQAYESAIKSASNDQAGTFRIRYEYALDLLAYDRVIESVDRFFVSRQSPYLLERLWADEQLLLYSWSIGDMTMAELYADELGREIPKASPRNDVDFEVRRMRTASEMHERFVKSRSGDPQATMSLDEECTVYDFRKRDHKRAMERLSPWVSRYPLDRYATWSEELKSVAVWTHLNFHAAQCLAGLNEEAVAGFDEIISKVPENEKGEMHVKAWCWRGYSYVLADINREEAKTSYELGLSLDAENAESGLPSGFLQPRIAGGKTSAESRAGYVANYRWLLNRMYFGRAGRKGQ